MKTKHTLANLVLILLITLTLALAGGPPNPVQADGETPPWSQRVALLSQYQGTSLGLAVSSTGQYVYFSRGPRLVIAEVNVTTGSVIGYRITQPMRGDIRAISLHGSYAYLAADDAGLIILDISNLDQIREVGSFYTGLEAYDVEIAGSYAYLAHRSGGLVILNISTPAQPTFVNQFTYGSSSFYTIEIIGNDAYIAGYFDGLLKVDVSNPASIPSPLSLKIDGQYAWGLKVVGSVAYVGFSDGLQAIKVDTNPMTFLGTQVQALGVNYSIAVEGSLAYMSNNNNGVCKINISNSADPVAAVSGGHACTDADYIPGTDKSPYAVHAAGGRVYTTNQLGMWIYQADAVVGAYFFDTWNIEYAIIHGDRQYVVGAHGLVINAAGDPNDRLAEYTAAGPLYKIIARDFGNQTYLFGWNGSSRLVSINVTNLAAITHTQTVKPEGAGGIADFGFYANSYLFAVTENPGTLLVYDLAKPDLSISPVMETLPAGVNPNQIEIFGYQPLLGSRTIRAYITAGTGGLYIYDVSNPTSEPNIVQLQHLVRAEESYISSIALLTQRSGLGDPSVIAIYLAEDWQVTILDGAAPSFARSVQFDTRASTYGLLVHDRRLYATDGSLGVSVYNLDNPLAPSLAGYYNTAGSINELVGNSDGSFFATSRVSGAYRLLFLPETIFLPAVRR